MLQPSDPASWTMDDSSSITRNPHLIGLAGSEITPRVLHPNDLHGKPMGAKALWEMYGNLKDEDKRMPWMTFSRRPEDKRLPWGSFDVKEEGKRLPWKSFGAKEEEKRLPWMSFEPKEEDKRMPWMSFKSKEEQKRLPWKSFGAKVEEKRLPWNSFDYKVGEKRSVADLHDSKEEEKRLPWKSFGERSNDKRIPWKAFNDISIASGGSHSKGQSWGTALGGMPGDAYYTKYNGAWNRDAGTSRTKRPFGSGSHHWGGSDGWRGNTKPEVHTEKRPFGNSVYKG